MTTLHTVQTKSIKSMLSLTNSDVDRVLEVVKAGAGVTSLSLRGELEFLELVNDFSQRVSLNGVIQRPAIEGYQGGLVVEGGFLATGALGLVKLA